MSVIGRHVNSDEFGIQYGFVNTLKNKGSILFYGKQQILYEKFDFPSQIIQIEMKQDAIVSSIANHIRNKI